MRIFFLLCIRVKLSQTPLGRTTQSSKLTLFTLPRKRNEAIKGAGLITRMKPNAIVKTTVHTACNMGPSTSATLTTENLITSMTSEWSSWWRKLKEKQAMKCWSSKIYLTGNTSTGAGLWRWLKSIKSTWIAITTAEGRQRKMRPEIGSSAFSMDFILVR